MVCRPRVTRARWSSRTQPRLSFPSRAPRGPTRRRGTARCSNAARERSGVGDDPGHCDVGLRLRNFGDELKVEGHGNGNSRGNEPWQRSIVVARAVTDAMPSWVDRERGNDDHVDPPGWHDWLAQRWLAVAEGMGLHRIRILYDAELDDARLWIDGRVSDAHAARAQQFVERPEIDLMAGLDRPEESDRLRSNDRLQTRQALHDA